MNRSKLHILQDPLYLNSAEFFVDDLNHSINFFRSDRPCSTLFSQKIHHVGGKFITSLVIFFHFLLINLPDLSQFVFIISMLNSSTVLPQLGG